MDKSTRSGVSQTPRLAPAAADSKTDLPPSFDLSIQTPRAQLQATFPNAAAILSAALDGPTLRILVADDSPANRLLMSLILGDVGAVVTVDDGREALDALEVGEFDLFISDMQMPVMDGLETIRRIRAREQTGGRSRLPIIVATADATFSPAQAALIGADAVLFKPFTAECVLEAVMLQFAEDVRKIG